MASPSRGLAARPGSLRSIGPTLKSLPQPTWPVSSATFEKTESGKVASVRGSERNVFRIKSCKRQYLRQRMMESTLRVVSIPLGRISLRTRQRVCRMVHIWRVEATGPECRARAKPVLREFASKFIGRQGGDERRLCCLKARPSSPTPRSVSQVSTRLGIPGLLPSLASGPQLRAPVQGGRR